LVNRIGGLNFTIEEEQHFQKRRRHMNATAKKTRSITFRKTASSMKGDEANVQQKCTGSRKGKCQAVLSGNQMFDFIFFS